jgi:hypothetical protein
MSRAKYNTSLRPGEIQVTEAGPGVFRFFAFNAEAQCTKHIGTVVGQTYEKVAAILRSPEPSLLLTVAELDAVIWTGAKFIRVQKGGTFSISVEDFQAAKVEYFHQVYGRQWRVPLSAFQSSKGVQKRNPILDNPVEPQADSEGWHRLDLFSR